MAMTGFLVNLSVSYFEKTLNLFESSYTEKNLPTKCKKKKGLVLVIEIILPIWRSDEARNLA